MNAKKQHIYIVLPVYNRLNYTKKCVASIFSQTYKDFTLILINDGSTDGTEEFIKSKYPSVKIINGNGNWWWTRSMYEGVKYALKKASKSDYVLEMNNDVYFGPNYFKELLKTSKKYPKSMIGSLCVRSQKPTEVVEAGVVIDWPTGLVYGIAQTVSQKLSYYKNMDVVKNIDALPGKGTLIPIEVFKKVGNFDFKRLPHYIADYEFANRAKRNGFELLVSTRAITKHYWEATGIFSNNPTERINYKRAWNLLFGRKSMNNIVDWVTFVLISCPKKYILRNLYFSSLKIVKSIVSVFPFYYLPPIYKVLLKIYYWSRLKSYKAYLKIKQFPEYHLK